MAKRHSVLRLDDLPGPSEPEALIPARLVQTGPIWRLRHRLWRLRRAARKRLRATSRAIKKSTRKRLREPARTVKRRSVRHLKRLRRAIYRRFGRHFIKHITSWKPRKRARRLATRFRRHLPSSPKRKIPRPSIGILKAEYRAKGLHTEPDTFALYRVLGNDLYARHQQGQTLQNLAFTLDHEPPLEACEKRWVVNRIFDRDQEEAILALLNERGQRYLHLPFDWDTYARIGWDSESFPAPGFFLSSAHDKLNEYDRSRADVQIRRHKNNYVMNNNGARNAALRDGRLGAKWVLPWDGNCFVTASAWAQIVRLVKTRYYLKYFAVPMARITNNAMLHDPGFTAEANQEPQILFRRDAFEEFDEAHPYGRRPKVELFWRLGLTGDWDSWYDDPWDLPRPGLALEAGQFGVGGWVARLSSGQADLETSDLRGLKDRGRARIKAIRETIDMLDREVISRRLTTKPLLSYADHRIEELKRTAESGDLAAERLVKQLCTEAEAALRRGPFAVTDKTTLPPSGHKHDYWHPAPYWWPDPDKPDGLPYIRRDGERMPGTELYEPGSEQYDRTSLQRLFDDTTVLALAAAVKGDTRYAEHGVRLVRRWFLDPESHMNPHLRYAQVRLGHNDNEGTPFGIVEMKDLYYFLDAVRLLERSGRFSEEDQGALAEWLRTYLQWLLGSDQGQRERRAKNNHGTLFDLQVASIAAYLGDTQLLVDTFRRASERLAHQFEANGRQPYELDRTTAQHYCGFNLQAWVNLAGIAARCGTDLWRPDVSGRGNLKKGLEWFLAFYQDASWPYSQDGAFERSRFFPLCHAYRDHYGVQLDRNACPAIGGAPERLAAPALYNPHYAIKPFWMLG